MGIKITKKLLNDYSRYKREIPLLERELSEMQTTESGLGSSTIFDYTTGYPRPQAVVGFDHALFERRQTVLANKKAKVAAAEEWIEKIENIQTRTVFKMRYIQGKTWARIAREMGYTGNEDYVRIRIRDEYLKKCGII